MAPCGANSDVMQYGREKARATEGIRVSTTGGIAAAVVKLGITVLERAGPKAIAWLKSLIFGKTILVIGQSRAGKTCFVDFLRHGIFDDESDTGKTLETTKTGRFDVKLGKDKTLEMIVESVSELPGQVGATEHANETYRENPHAVVLLLDLTTPLKGEPDRSSIGWLTTYCERLETLWRANKKRKKNKIQFFVVLLNKKDKVKDGIVKKCVFEAKKVLKQELKDALGGTTDDVSVMLCCLVNNESGPKLAESAVIHLAKSLGDER